LEALFFRAEVFFAAALRAGAFFAALAAGFFVVFGAAVFLVVFVALFFAAVFFAAVFFFAAILTVSRWVGRHSGECGECTRASSACGEW
jgi:hypothetical protein